ncbi:RmlC-like cupin [Calocera cornea HHB12733]|uniref:RmlC-like cupin n=1 Tax=Calocera cornea HHB12733 TaxID=1353952 RepID=A0A165DMP6_9BASI|nr:RmlC-like cupin [Calocera cornea HHB12733]
MPGKLLEIIPRPSTERGNADHGWLKTFHTFSFASYYDPNHDGFGALRVLNEDRVRPGTGFGTHPHREFEIFSYVVSGELEHRDSMGNVEVLKRGDLQLTSAGTGIRHSEKTYGSKPVHFLQIWALPSRAGLAPTYFTRHFSDKDKTNNWVRIVAPVGAEGVSETREAEGPAPVNSPVTLWAAILTPGTKLPHTFPVEGAGKGRKAYVHVVQTGGYNEGPATGATVRLSGEGKEVELREGDGAYVMGLPGREVQVQNVGEGNAEVLFFDIE